MQHLRHSSLLAKTYREYALDIGLNTFPSIVYISQVRECIPQTIKKAPRSRDTLAHVLKRLPWFVVHSCCFIAFTVQIVQLVVNQTDPAHTVSSTSKKTITAGKYLVFKICMKPGFDETNLHEASYSSPAGFFFGKSWFNDSLVGWVRHINEGHSQMFQVCQTYFVIFCFRHPIKGFSIFRCGSISVDPPSWMGLLTMCYYILNNFN